ncbi:DEAD/DEAH box helicase [Hoyosella sp. YIM 151337]|uniref:DEAD/DEAH box helicase n=1 Tax=Hoyosella sp. YIM 151337 TaxID=2992742 RepID=UPI0022369B3E|nr:DEAD/DEAH box helicase [Hoyosella sp. YIM 151337]MCW4354176.1 DEAD/DEAH box helicase [Hoyosella sp. YIM 151337]
MESTVPLRDDSRLSFGYHPECADVDVPLKFGRFTRALIVGLPVQGLYGRTPECRFMWKADDNVAEGLYWFRGIEHGSLLVQVGGADLPADAVVVEEPDLDENHPLAAIWNWAEDQWLQAEPVPAPLFELHEAAITSGGLDVVIQSRRFLREWSYTVLVEGRREEVFESRLKPRPQIDDPTTWVVGEPVPATRFGATLTRAKLRGRFANTLFSFRATRTTFRPYQFKPVLKLLQTGKARLLIADEVGLGKTIEAGLIWTELEARQEADRVLVVCPSSLLGKWQGEMEERFGFELLVLDRNELKKFHNRHSQNRLPKRQAYIASLETLRTWSALEEVAKVPPEFDLIILDEAHSMRNKETKSYALGTELADWADNLVFLSATPINLGLDDLQNLLQLLAPEDCGDIEDLKLRLEPNRIINSVTAQLGLKGVSGRALNAELRTLATVALGDSIMQRPEYKLLTDLLNKDKLSPGDVVEAKRYVADLNMLSTLITRTRKVEVDDRKAARRESRIEVHWKPAEEKFYSEYLKWCIDRAREANGPLYYAMQMPLRLASACLPMARKAVLDPSAFGRITDADAEASSERLEPHPELVRAAHDLPESLDSKFDELTGILRELHQERKQALLFTHSRPTLSYLHKRLAGDYRVAVMHGGVSRDQRAQIMGDFRAGIYDFVLANRVASEGLDFEFCSAVINYDLPWNPMEVEQRIGRIDRIGQMEETIMVVNFINESTIDERILSRLLARIEIFKSSIGALEPIIAVEAKKALDAGLDFTLSPEEREQKIHEALTAVEEQRRGLEEVSDASSALLVSNDVDVAGLEEELMRTGRYIGQRELAQLLDDWAQVDGAQGVTYLRGGQSIEFRGNAAMAARVDELTQKLRRTRAETNALAAKLREEMPIPMVLDQELARTRGAQLLTATSPLVMAATDMPSHRHARYASLQVSADGKDVVSGLYIVVMAKAVSASRGGDEIWGAAVTHRGTPAGEGPPNALLAALAQGALWDEPLPQIQHLPKLAERALNQLMSRHQTEQEKRDREFDALQQTRLVTVGAQYERKIQAIEQRIQSARSAGRDESVIGLFESQKRRAKQRFDRILAELRDTARPEIRLEPLAACVLRVTAREGQ